MKLRLLDNPYGLLLVSLRVHGETHTACIDTGCSRTCIHPRLIPTGSHKRIVRRAMYSSMSGHFVPNYEVRCQFNFIGVTINEVTINDALVQQEHDTGLSLSIFIGQDLLRQYRRVTVDYVAKTIEFVV